MEPSIGQYFMETKFGRIFYLCCGFKGDPLILIIHGSGPNNSSQEYNFLLFEYIAKICFIRRFFIVAIDCPGYGNSSGSKQSVRSYPLELIEEIYQALNYTKAFALFGHSQGGSSIFNAVFQKNDITEILLMDRPVCGDIKRFLNFPIPCLLVYDIEDDGHPIAQGRLLNKYLKFSRLLTFKSSKEPFWIADFLWESILEFLRKFDEGLAKRSSSLNQKRDKGIIPIEVENFGRLNIRSHHSEEKLKKEKNKENENSKKNNEEKEINFERKNKFIEKIKKEEIKQEEKDVISLQKPQKLVETINYEEKKLNNDEKKEQIIPKKVSNLEENKTDLQEYNYLCSLCLDIFYKPIQLNCSHNFCITCLNDLSFYENKCPLCRKQFAENYDKTDKNLNQKLIEEMQEKLPEKRLVNRAQKALVDQQNQSKKVLFMGYGYEFKEILTKPRVGNAQNSKKFEWKVFVKQLNFAKQNMIKFVEFDINVGIIGSKPIKVEKMPFVLEGKGGFTFTTNIKVTWDGRMRIPAYETFQRVDFQGGNVSKKFMIRLN